MTSFHPSVRDIRASRVAFIVGVGRSGTSLLQSMLAANSHTIVMPETSALRRLVYSGSLSSAYRRGGRSDLDQVIQSDERLGFLGVDLASCTESAISEERFDALVWYQSLLDSFRGESDAWLVDKDPKLIEYLPAISRAFPDCSVIHVIRDPRDVLLSRKKAAWSQNRPWWLNVVAIQSQFAFGVESGFRDFRGRYYQVFYEHLIVSPEKVLRSLCTQIGIPFDIGMLNFEKSAASLVRSSELGWKAKTFEKVDPGNKLKWKTGLTDFETAVCELTCNQTIDLANYERSRPLKQLSFFSRVCIWLVVYFIRATGIARYIVLRWRARRLCHR